MSKADGYLVSIDGDLHEALYRLAEHAAATDFLRVNARGMARTTTFTWQVGGRTVAQKRVRTR